MDDKKSNWPIYALVLGLISMVGAIYFLSKRNTEPNRSPDHMEKMRAAKAAKAQAEAEELEEEVKEVENQLSLEDELK